MEMKTKVKVLRWNEEDTVLGMLTATWQQRERAGRGEWKGLNVHVN